MCSYIVKKAALSGSAKGPKGWMKIDTANVYFDHPYHAPLDHALGIDFINEAEGARERTGSDYAISVTGIAGPSGGTEAKPVGTVFIGLAKNRGTQVRQHRNNYDRETFKYVTSQQALEMLRRAILENERARTDIN